MEFCVGSYTATSLLKNIIKMLRLLDLHRSAQSRRPNDVTIRSIDSEGQNISSSSPLPFIMSSVDKEYTYDAKVIQSWVCLYMYTTSSQRADQNRSMKAPYQNSRPNSSTLSTNNAPRIATCFSFACLSLVHRQTAS